MLFSKIAGLTLLGLAVFNISAAAQTTNFYVAVATPPTVLEQLESTNSQLIVKGTAPIGTVYIVGGAISVICKEDLFPASGRKEHGIRIGFQFGNQPEERTVLDYDELAPLLSALDFLNKINWSVTSLTGFDASYTSKGGFRVNSFSSKRAGQIEISMRNASMPKGILIAPDQFAQFRSYIEQAKAKLDDLRRAG
jgi:hypothetical protein